MSASQINYAAESTIRTSEICTSAYLLLSCDFYHAIDAFVAIYGDC
jgi:hypothetical protein